MARWIAGVFVMVTCLRVWTGPADFVPQAHAQIPDSGLQRKQLLDEVQRTNQLLEEVIHILRTQTIKVALPSTDKPRSGIVPPNPQDP